MRVSPDDVRGCVNSHLVTKQLFSIFAPQRVTGQHARHLARLLCRLATMNASIAPVAELLAVTSDEAFVLLKQCGWRKRKLEEEYFDCPEETRKKYGVSAGMPVCCRCGVSWLSSYSTSPCLAGPDPAPPPAGISSIFCPVLMDDCSIEDADAPACGHWFSKEAWVGHLQQAMSEPRTALTLKVRWHCTHCAWFGCGHSLAYDSPSS